MANVPNDLSTLNGFFKEIYAGGIKVPIPASAVLYNMWKLKSEKKIGNKYHQPVVLSAEQGFTYGGSTSTVFDLNDAVAAVMQDAQVEGAEIVGRSQIAAGVINRAMESKGAFAKTTKHLIKMAMAAHYKRAELSILYGRQGLGEVLNTTGTSGTTLVIQFTEASWSAALWCGMKNARLDVYSAISSGTKRTNSATDCIVTAVDLANRKITCSADSGDAGDVAAGDEVYFKGAYSTADMAGLDLLVTNTGALHNITASDYPDVWQGSSYDVNGLLTMGKLLNAATQAAERGYEGELLAVIPSKAFATLNAAESAMRQYDGSYSKGKASNGYESIEFFGQTGKIVIMPHLYMKDGMGLLLPKDEIQKIGTRDVTFEDPANPGEYFHRLEDKNGYELRCFSDFAIFCDAPSHMVKLTGITY